MTLSIRGITIYLTDTSCGAAYLGVLEAIKEYLLAKGLTKKELPKKVEEFSLEVAQQFNFTLKFYFYKLHVISFRMLNFAFHQCVSIYRTEKYFATYGFYLTLALQ